eukprot:COSAG02_NODE_5932_length_3934_cov_4285.433116_3_plen_219_part_00
MVRLGILCRDTVNGETFSYFDCEAPLTRSRWPPRRASGSTMDFDGPAPHGGGSRTLEAQLFAMLKPLRGTLVQTSTMGTGDIDKEIRVVATRQDEGNSSVLLVTALVNERPTELELELSVGELNGVVVVNSTMLAMDHRGVSVVKPATLRGDAIIVPSLGVLVVQQVLQRNDASAIQRRQVINESFCADVFNLVGSVLLIPQCNESSPWAQCFPLYLF